MCFNPFKLVERVFQSIFGGGPQPGPTGPTTHAKGLANRLRRPDAGETTDQDLKKEKGETETDLSEAQSDALARTADSTKQTDKAQKNKDDLIAALSGLTAPPTGVTAPTGAATNPVKGGGGAGY